VQHKHHEKRCEEWSTKLRDRGVTVTWTVLYGRADQVLAEHAAESRSSVILFSLHRSGNHMIDCPDGVVSGTIRQAFCPVMTVPPALPH
jgi:methylmalonyl-CoA mutase cobalamin-binding subunit